VLAAARAGAVDVVKALLDRGTKIDAQALGQAADAGDAATMRLLIERGADPGMGTMPTDFSMRSGCIDCVDLLLRSAGKPALTRALESVARYGDSNSMRMLLERGAEATAEALRLAAASEWAPLDGITTLLERGARHEQALDLAARQVSWYVHSRVIPIQPYFDSEFPHGKDQFISAAATNWATMALTWTAR
jgi:hypothetical protein